MQNLSESLAGRSGFIKLDLFNPVDTFLDTLKRRPRRHCLSFDPGKRILLTLLFAIRQLLYFQSKDDLI